MSDKALQALDKLIPAPSTKAHQFYLAHYEVIRDEITRLQAENEALRARVAELEKCLSVAHQILDDQGATSSIMGRFRKALAGDAEQTGGEK